MSENNVHKVKASALRALLKNDKLSAQVWSAVDSAPGSSARKSARRHLKVVDMAARQHMSKGQYQSPDRGATPVVFDGQGGPNDVGIQQAGPVMQPSMGAETAASPMPPLMSVAHGFNLPSTGSPQPSTPLSSPDAATVTPAGSASTGTLPAPSSGAPKTVKRSGANGTYRVTDYTDYTRWEDTPGGARALQIIAERDPKDPRVVNFVKDLAAGKESAKAYAQAGGQNFLNFMTKLVGTAGSGLLDVGATAMQSAYNFLFGPSDQSAYQSPDMARNYFSDPYGGSGQGNLGQMQVGAPGASSAAPARQETEASVRAAGKQAGLPDAQVEAIIKEYAKGDYNKAAKYISDSWGGAGSTPLGVNQNYAPTLEAGRTTATMGDDVPQELVNAKYQKAYNDNVAKGMDPASAAAAARVSVMSTYPGYSPTIGATPDKSDLTANLQNAAIKTVQWLMNSQDQTPLQTMFAALTPDQQAKLAPAMNAVQMKVGGDKFASMQLHDPKAIAAATGVPEAEVRMWPIDAFGQANVDAISNAVNQKYGIAGLEDEMLNQGILAGSATEIGRRYIRENDAFVHKLDDMIEAWDSQVAYKDTSDPYVAASAKTYRNYLTGLKNDQIQRYSALLTDSAEVSQRNYETYSAMVQAQQGLAKSETELRTTQVTNAIGQMREDWKGQYDMLDELEKSGDDEANSHWNRLQMIANAAALPDATTLAILTAQHNAKLVQSGVVTGTNDTAYKPDFARSLFWETPPSTDADGGTNFGVHRGFLSPTEIRQRATGAQFGTAVSDTVVSDYAQQAGLYFSSAMAAGQDVSGDLTGILSKAGPEDAAWAKTISDAAIESADDYVNRKDPDGKVLQAFAKDMNKGKKDAAALHAAYDAKLGRGFVTAMIDIDLAERELSDGKQGAFFDSISGVDASKNSAEAKNAGAGAYKAYLSFQALPYTQGSPKAPSPGGSTAGAGAAGGDISTALKSIPTATKWGEGWRSQNVGECGALVNDLTGLGVGNDLKSKLAVCDPRLKSQDAKPGDVIVQNIGPYGHIAIVNEVKVGPDGRKTLVLTEANYHLDKKTTVDRQIAANDPRIVGVARPFNA